MSTRIALALVVLITGFALAGCGLSPVYGSYADKAGAPVAAAFDTIYIDNIPDRTGQKLRNILMDRFYKNGQPSLANSAYRLRVATVSESIYGLGIAKDATATRSQIKLSTSFSLVRTNDPQAGPVISRVANAVSSFNTLASQYTTLVTEEDARDQTIRDLAEQITTMIELYFTNPAAFSKPAAIDEAAAAMTARDRRLQDSKIMRDPRLDIDDRF